MEVCVVGAENCPDGCILSLSAGGSRRTAPLAPRQKLSFGQAAAHAAVAPGGSGIKVDVLKVTGTTRILSQDIGIDVGNKFHADPENQKNWKTANTLSCKVHPTHLGRNRNEAEILAKPINLALTVKSTAEKGSSSGGDSYSPGSGSAIGSARNSNADGSSIEEPLNMMMPANDRIGLLALPPGSVAAQKLAHSRASSLPTLVRQTQSPGSVGSAPGFKLSGPKLSRKHHTALEARSYLEEHSVLPMFEQLIRTLVKERPNEPWKYVASMLPGGANELNLEKTTKKEKVDGGEEAKGRTERSEPEPEMPEQPAEQVDDTSSRPDTPAASTPLRTQKPFEQTAFEKTALNAFEKTGTTMAEAMEGQPQSLDHTETFETIDTVHLPADHPAAPAAGETQFPVADKAADDDFSGEKMKQAGAGAGVMTDTMSTMAPGTMTMRMGDTMATTAGTWFSDYGHERKDGEPPRTPCLLESVLEPTKEEEGSEPRSEVDKEKTQFLEQTQVQVIRADEETEVVELSRPSAKDELLVEDADCDDVVYCPAPEATMAAPLGDIVVSDAVEDVAVAEAEPTPKVETDLDVADVTSEVMQAADQSGEHCGGTLASDETKDEVTVTTTPTANFEIGPVSPEAIDSAMEFNAEAEAADQSAEHRGGTPVSDATNHEITANTTPTAHLETGPVSPEARDIGQAIDEAIEFNTEAEAGEEDAADAAAEVVPVKIQEAVDKLAQTSADGSAVAAMEAQAEPATAEDMGYNAEAEAEVEAAAEVMAEAEVAFEQPVSAAPESEEAGAEPRQRPVEDACGPDVLVPPTRETTVVTTAASSSSFQKGDELCKDPDLEDFVGDVAIEKTREDRDVATDMLGGCIPKLVLRDDRDEQATAASVSTSPMCSGSRSGVTQRSHTMEEWSTSMEGFTYSSPDSPAGRLPNSGRVNLMSERGKALLDPSNPDIVEAAILRFAFLGLSFSRIAKKHEVVDDLKSALQNGIADVLQEPVACVEVELGPGSILCTSVIYSPGGCSADAVKRKLDSSADQFLRQMENLGMSVPGVKALLPEEGKGLDATELETQVRRWRRVRPAKTGKQGGADSPLADKEAHALLGHAIPELMLIEEEQYNEDRRHSPSGSGTSPMYSDGDDSSCGDTPIGARTQPLADTLSAPSPKRPTPELELASVGSSEEDRPSSGRGLGSIVSKKTSSSRPGSRRSRPGSAFRNTGQLATLLEEGADCQVDPSGEGDSSFQDHDFRPHPTLDQEHLDAMGETDGCGSTFSQVTSCMHSSSSSIMDVMDIDPMHMDLTVATPSNGEPATPSVASGDKADAQPATPSAAGVDEADAPPATPSVAGGDKADAQPATPSSAGVDEADAPPALPNEMAAAEVAETTKQLPPAMDEDVTEPLKQLPDDAQTTAVEFEFVEAAGVPAEAIKVLGEQSAEGKVPVVLRDMKTGQAVQVLARASVDSTLMRSLREERAAQAAEVLGVAAAEGRVPVAIRDQRADQAIGALVGATLDRTVSGAVREQRADEAVHVLATATLDGHVPVVLRDLRSGEAVVLLAQVPASGLVPGALEEAEEELGPEVEVQAEADGQVPVVLRDQRTGEAVTVLASGFVPGALEELTADKAMPEADKVDKIDKASAVSIEEKAASTADSDDMAARSAATSKMPTEASSLVEHMFGERVAGGTRVLEIVAGVGNQSEASEAGSVAASLRSSRLHGVPPIRVTRPDGSHVPSDDMGSQPTSVMPTERSFTESGVDDAMSARTGEKEEKEEEELTAMDHFEDTLEHLHTGSVAFSSRGDFRRSGPTTPMTGRDKLMLTGNFEVDEGDEEEEIAKALSSEMCAEMKEAARPKTVAELRARARDGLLASITNGELMSTLADATDDGPRRAPGKVPPLMANLEAAKMGIFAEAAINADVKANELDFGEIEDERMKLERFERSCKMALNENKKLRKENDHLRSHLETLLALAATPSTTPGNSEPNSPRSISVA